MIFNEKINYLINLSNSYPSQGSNEWIEMRKKIVTGTTAINAIKKTYPKILIPSDEFIGNWYTNYGNFCEPVAKRIYEKEYDDVIIDLNFLMHKTIKNLGGSFDGFSVKNECLIEIKCLQKKPNVIKETYLIQMQLYLKILYSYGIDTYCLFLVLLPDETLHITKILRDENFWMTAEQDVSEYVKYKQNAINNFNFISNF
jgi:hypothetical protein